MVLELRCDFSSCCYQLKFLNSNTFFIVFLFTYSTCHKWSNFLCNFGWFCKFWEFLSTITLFTFSVTTFTCCRTTSFSSFVNGDLLFSMRITFCTILSDSPLECSYQQNLFNRNLSIESIIVINFIYPYEFKPSRFN